MLTCPYCKNALTEQDLARQLCPHCEQVVQSGLGTIDSASGAVTLVLPAHQDEVDGASEKQAGLTLADPRLSQTLDTADIPAADIRLHDIPPGISDTLDSAEPSSVSDPRWTRTLDSADLPGSPEKPWPGSAPRTMQNRGNDDRTLDSSIASESVQPSGGSSAIQPPLVAGDDVERRLQQVWGSQMASSRPHVTMRGTGEEHERGEERSTLIIRERALHSHRTAPLATNADYDLLGVLGEGGMGVVYNARQASIDREVAIKMLKPDFSMSPAQRRKFLSEAAVTGELDHPNIVPIYDLGQNADGALFYSMKKVTGTPWSQVLKQKSVLDNLTILMKVADAVAFAHARGVVHRDLKPENVMLGDFGEVLVLDWGLAVATDGHRPTPNVATAFNIAGTPAYMAPELAFGPLSAIGRHSDIYLLGAILYECITGRPPHAGKSARECLRAAARNEIIPTEKRGELLDIALQAMATDPAQRHASVQAFQEAIRSYQAHSESIALCERGEQAIREAAKSDDYRDYARALFAFEEAFQLWPGNEHAHTGIGRAKLHYAASALGKSDFDLGLSLLDEQDPSHATVRQQLLTARAERDARQHRLKRARRMMAALGVAVFLAVGAGTVASTYQAYRASRSEQRAVASATLAKKNEGDAKRNAATAKTEASRAKAAKLEADRNREEAVAAAYKALIAMAAARIDENSFDQARLALDQCDPKHRGWEWRRLRHVVEQGDVSQIAIPSRAESLAVNRAGTLLATGSQDGIVRVWDRARRELVGQRDIDRQAVRVTALAFHPLDDHWLVVGTSDGSQPLVAWNRTSDELRLPSAEQRHTDAVTQATFSADGKSLLTASHDRTARLWNWETLVPQIFAGHTAAVRSADLSGDGQLIATASDDGTVRLWSTSTGQQLRSATGQRIPFAQHQGAVHAVVFLPAPEVDRPDAAHLATAANRPMPAAYYLASAGYDKRVLLWQTDRLAPFDLQGLVAGRAVAEPAYEALTGHSAAIGSLSLSADGTRLLSAGIDHTVRVWQIVESDQARRGSLIKELRGHAGPVYAALFAPDDANAAFSTGYDGRLRLWDIDLYQEQRTLPGVPLRGHLGPVLSARYSPAGETIVTASLDRTARQWSASSGVSQKLFREGHAYLASRVAFFPVSRKLMTAGGDGTVRVWDLDKQAELLALEQTGYRAAAAISPDERWILTGSSEIQLDSDRPHRAIVWNAATGEQASILSGPHKAPLTCVAFGPAGQEPLAMTGDDNGVFQLWNPETGQPLGPRIDQHASPLIGAAFARDGRLLITADTSGQVFAWDLADRASPRRVHAYSHPAGVHSVALAPGGAVITGGADGVLRVFAGDGAKPLWSSEPMARLPARFVATEAPIAEAIRAVDVGWDAARQLAVVAAIDAVHQPSQTGIGGLDEEFVRLFELDFARNSFREVTSEAAVENRYLINLRAQGAAGWSVAMSADGQQLATVGRDEARLWSCAGSEMAAFRPHQDLTFAEFSHRGDAIATASLDSSVRVWDAETGRARMTLDHHTAGKLGGHQRPVNCALFMPDDGHILTGSEDGTVRKWDLSTQRVVQVISIGAQGITRIALSGDGKSLFVGSRSGLATRWNLDQPSQPATVFQGHEAEVLDLCLAEGEAWLVTGSADNTAKIWNATTGRELLTLKGHASEVTSVAILLDGPGMRVLTGSNDQTAKLWAVSGLDETASQTASMRPVQGHELLSLRGHMRGVTSVAFAPDGSAALTASRDGLSILWPAIGIQNPERGSP